jgi:hypothetical protein
MPRDDDDDDRPRKRRPDPDEDDDDRPRRRRSRDDDDDDRPRRSKDDGGVSYVIPYKNVPALISYYVGVFGLILCILGGLSLFSGVTAIVLGIMGMMRASKNPQAHGRGHAITGMILGGVQVLAACGWVGLFVTPFFAGRK